MTTNATVCRGIQGRIAKQVNLENMYTVLGSAVVRASAYGTGGPGFDSRSRVIPMTLKMVVMASLLGAQELRVSITTDSSVSIG